MLRTPMPAPAKQRNRTVTQMERKRSIDREHQRLARQKNRNRMDRLEEDILHLHREFGRMLDFMKTMQPVDFGQSPRTQPYSADFVEKTVFSAGLSSPMPSSSPSIVVSSASTTTSSSASRADQLPHKDSENSITSISHLVESVATTNKAQLPLIENCVCAGSHASGTAGFEETIFTALSAAHTALLHEPDLCIQNIPRSPSLADFLLGSSNENRMAEILNPLFVDLLEGPVVEMFACYFVLYRLLRWRIYPEPSSYQDIPSWFRPSEIQETVPHSLSIDFLAFPDLRDALITRAFNVDTQRFYCDFWRALTVCWPKSKNILYKVQGCEVTFHPDFESHIYNLENWKLKGWWANEYTELGSCVNLLD